MKNNLYKIAFILTMSTLIVGCKKQDNKQDIVVENTQEQGVIIESIINETDKELDKNKDKDKNNSTDNNKLTSNMIDSTDNYTVSLEDPKDIEIEDIHKTSGKIIDTSFDFSIYELDNSNVNNDLQLFDGDYDKYLKELNSYITQLNILKLNRIVRYLDDDTYEKEYKTTLESDIRDANIYLEALDTKNVVINSYFEHVPNLVNAWNEYYQEMTYIRDDISNLDKTNVRDLNLISANKSASIVLSILNNSTSYIQDSTYIEETDSE